MTQAAIHTKLAAISYESEQGQRLILVMAALEVLGGENTKQETIEHVFENGWYVILKGDFQKYESTGEPKIHNWLAWGRKHAVLRDWGLSNQRNAWALSKNGRRVLDSIRNRFLSQEWDVRKCDLWSPAFKRHIDPNYKPSDRDMPRRPRKAGRVEIDETTFKEIMQDLQNTVYHAQNSC